MLDQDGSYLKRMVVGLSRSYLTLGITLGLGTCILPECGCWASDSVYCWVVFITSKLLSILASSVDE